jgi:hypothetical protein
MANPNLLPGALAKPQSRAAQKKQSDREKGKHWLMLRSLVSVRQGRSPRQVPISRRL